MCTSLIRVDLVTRKSLWCHNGISVQVSHRSIYRHPTMDGSPPTNSESSLQIAATKCAKINLFVSSHAFRVIVGIVVTSCPGTIVSGTWHCTVHHAQTKSERCYSLKCMFATGKKYIMLGLPVLSPSSSSSLYHNLTFAIIITTHSTRTISPTSITNQTSNYEPILPHHVSTLRPRQNGRHFADDTFKHIFVMKMLQFRLKFHWSLFIRIQLTIFQHWFSWWLGADQATSHYLKQWWLDYGRVYASLGLNELINYRYTHRDNTLSI